MTSSATNQTLDEEEVQRFAQTAVHWWDENGPFRPLHKLNPARLAFIRKSLTRHFRRDDAGLRPFKGLSMLDLGCGGGLICEPMARLGASVTGADVSDETVQVAAAHAQMMNLPIQYKKATAEGLSKDRKRYDVVFALEVIEHVAEPDIFLSACRHLVKDDGILIFSTLNRTVKSFAMGILAAEYILGWVPRGTHDWHKFVTPEEFRTRLEKAGFHPDNMAGLRYDALGDRWIGTKDLSVNYMGAAKPLAI